jgi:hypothetical protein
MLFSLIKNNHRYQENRRNGDRRASQIFKIWVYACDRKLLPAQAAKISSWQINNHPFFGDDTYRIYKS